MAGECSEGTVAASGAHAWRGRLVLVVGPSGAGKDTLIKLAQQEVGANGHIVFVRRTVTRPATTSEDNIETTREQFAAAEAAGGFALSWSAHGNRYGIACEIDAALAAGLTVVANVSRTVIEQARSRYGNVLVVYVDAKRELREERLAARLRESDGPLAERLLSDPGSEPGRRSGDILIENNGTPRDAALQLVACLLPSKGA